MNIVVLSGSPRKGANTDTMVEAFAETAREAGHTVEVVRVAGKKIAGCLGCQYCFAHEGACVQKDDMAGVVEALKGADMVVFASPIYWFDITAQEKAAIEKEGAELPYAALYEKYPYLNITEWSVADVNGDLAQCGLSGSPTKVKTIQNISFQAKESKTLTGSDRDVEDLIVELLANHTIG